MRKTTGRTGNAGKRGKPAPSVPFRVADHLKTDSERAAYLQAVLDDGDARVLTIALRDMADSIGGVAKLAEHAGLSRETLYRTLSPRGNPRLDTLTALLGALGLRLSVKPRRKAA